MGELMDEQKTKELFKQAMVELLEERRDLFIDLFADIIEEMMLANAIREGVSTAPVDREDIFRILDSES